jgi:hypothetical protein
MEVKKTEYEQLLESAKRAIRSRDRSLFYQEYGAAKEAVHLGAITWDEFMTLNDILVRDGLNKPQSYDYR